ncbi:MAG: hypothetical protein ACE5PM_04495 [Candidatus Hydrothermarchaeales archaeon]
MNGEILDGGIGTKFPIRKAKLKYRHELKVVSFRDIISLMNESLLRDKKSLRDYLVRDLGGTYSFPAENILFEAVLAWLNGDRIDALVLEDTGHKVLDYDPEFHTFLQVLFRKMRPEDEDALSFAIRMAELTKPKQGFVHRAKFGKGYQERWSKFEEALKAIKEGSS